jgi:hypothetical protein
VDTGRSEPSIAYIEGGEDDVQMFNDYLIQIIFGLRSMNKDVNARKPYLTRMFDDEKDNEKKPSTQKIQDYLVLSILFSS